LCSQIESSNSITFTSHLNHWLGFTSKNLNVLPDQVTTTSISERKVSITDIDKVHLKCDCVDGSIFNGKREPIIYSFGLDEPPGHKIFKTPQKILYKRVNKERIDGIAFNFHDNDRNSVNFNGETISFTIQLQKKLIQTKSSWATRIWKYLQ